MSTSLVKDLEYLEAQLKIPATGATTAKKTQGKGAFTLEAEKLLMPDAQGNINEEELQFSLVAFLLGEESQLASESFLVAFNEVLGVSPGIQAEDAVTFALQSVVDEGKISRELAELIHGKSFLAAQLDENLSALFDSRGSGTDMTIAVEEMGSALQRAEEALLAMENGQLEASPRSLDAPSNVAPSSISSSAPSGLSGGSSREGFLWKPTSESDGRLVVLLPPSLTGKVESAAIYASLPASEANLLENGRFTGDRKNGGRAHFRFSKAGSGYPDGVFLVANLKDGSQLEFQIRDTGRRVEG